MLKDKEKFESSKTQTTHLTLISHQEQWGPEDIGMTYSKC